MAKEYTRRPGVIVRMLIGGMLIFLSLPLLSPFIVGTVITRAIYGLHVLTRRLSRTLEGGAWLPPGRRAGDGR